MLPEGAARHPGYCLLQGATETVPRAYGTVPGSHVNVAGVAGAGGIFISAFF
jgi:hypothetical protein